jgi:hypothetical protein
VIKMKKLVFPVLIMALFFGNVQKANAVDPISALVAQVVGKLVYDGAKHVIGKIVGGVVHWEDGSQENAQEAEKNTGVDFDDDGDTNGDGYNEQQ